jgi:tetratricopeptide (TPR) repeat protein
MHMFQSVALIWLIVIISCSSFLRNPDILSIIHSGTTNTSTSSNSLSSIQVLTRKKKEASPEILLAIKQCENAILRPKNDEMLKGPSFCLALLKQSLGDLEGALVDYQRALLRCPQNGAASYNIGGILENLGRDSDAAISYKNAMAVNETYEAAFSRLIPLLLRTNEVNEAKTICINMSINGPSTGRYLAYEKLGVTLHKMGLKQESLTAYEKALNICNDPLQSSDLSEKRLVDALNNAAQAASTIISGSAVDMAEKYFQQSIRTNTENADTLVLYDDTIFVIGFICILIITISEININYLNE